MLDGVVPDEEIKRLSRGMKALSSFSTENKEKNIRFKTERERERERERESERDEERVNFSHEVIGFSRKSYFHKEKT